MNRFTWLIEREGEGLERTTYHWLEVDGQQTEYFCRKVGDDMWEIGGPDFSEYVFSWQAGRAEVIARYQRAVTEAGDEELHPLTEVDARQIGMLLTALAQAATSEMPDERWNPTDRLVSHCLCLTIQRAEALQASAGSDDRLAGNLAAIKMLTSREAWSSAELASKARELAADRLAGAGIDWNPEPDQPEPEQPVAPFQRPPKVH